MDTNYPENEDDHQISHIFISFIIEYPTYIDNTLQKLSLECIEYEWGTIEIEKSFIAYLSRRKREVLYDHASRRIKAYRKPVQQFFNTDDQEHQQNENVEEKDIKASYDNGELKITFPKEKEKLPENKTIMIE